MESLDTLREQVDALPDFDRQVVNGIVRVLEAQSSLLDTLATAMVSLDALRNIEHDTLALRVDELVRERNAA